MLRLFWGASGGMDMSGSIYFDLSIFHKAVISPERVACVCIREGLSIRLFLGGFHQIEFRFDMGQRTQLNMKIWHSPSMIENWELKIGPSTKSHSYRS
jgi:hypothetical protein